ncbi:uncharacterized protein [Panulirus ornatus]|uniref:uncharacterized protein isoform X1 n=1 Tax=Panulirus ornatus TaxID=150431 RepID=UPI003A8857C3
MAAPQQDTLTNVPCTPVTTPTVLATTYRSAAASADNYGSGQSANCSDVYGRLSCVSVRSVGTPGVPCGTIATHYPSPRPASRRVRPCTLCGTTALRPCTAVVSPGPLEQPVVLLHRLEDGLPQGDVNSLRAYGTIRLLPVHSPSQNDSNVLEDYNSDRDRDTDEGEVNHAMAQSVKVGEEDKDKEESSNTQYTTWANRGSDDSHLSSEASGDHVVSDRSVGAELNSEVKNSVNVTEKKVEESDSHFLGIRIHSVVLGEDQDTGYHREEGNVCVGDRSLASWGSAITSPPQNTPTTSASIAYSSSLPCQPSCSASCPSHQPLTRALPPPLLVPAAVSRLSCHDIDPVPSTAQLVSSHSTLSASHTNPSVTYTILSTRRHSPLVKHPSTASTQPFPSITDSSILATACQQSSFPSLYTSVSNVFSSTVLPLSSSMPDGCLVSSLLGSQTQHPNSPPSPPSSPLSSLSTLPFGSGHEQSHLACSVDSRILAPSSPYSPRTLPSSPASPASLPSRVESPPSPTPSCGSPPPSPDFLGLPHAEIRQLSPHLFSEIHEKDTGTSALTSQVGVSLNSQDKQSDQRLTKVCQDDLSLESEVKRTRESESDLKKCTVAVEYIKSQMDAQVELSAPFQVNPSEAIQVEKPKAPQMETFLNKVKTQVESFEDTKTVPFLDSKEIMIDNKELSVESAEGSAEYCECVRNQTDAEKRPMRIKFRLRHKLDIPLPLGTEKKEGNKDNGIPKIVLTLKGNGPNKEYCCSNKLSEGQSSSVDVDKKHKWKKDKRQRFRCKGKIKKGLKGNKHKRHMELFGEYSNDSCDIGEKCNGTAGRNEQLNETAVKGQKGLPIPVAFPTLGESPEHNDDLSSTPVEKESCAFSVKVEKVCEKIKCSPGSDSLDDSFSDSLPDTEPNQASEDEILKDENIKSPVMEEEVQKCKDKVESALVEDRLQNESSQPILSEEFAVANSTQSEKTLQESSVTISATNTTISSSPLTIPEKLTSQREPEPTENTRGCTLRSRRDRLVKNTESDRDSDTCLWVSFGVDGPVPLPASDVPSLEPILSSSTDTSKSGDSDHDTGSSLSADDCQASEKNNQVTTVRQQGVREKFSEAVSEIYSVDRLVEERAELLVKEYNERQKILSSGYPKVQSLDNEVKDCTSFKKDVKVKRDRRSSSYKAKESSDKVRLSSKLTSKSSSSVEGRKLEKFNDASLVKVIPSEKIIRLSNTYLESSANNSPDGAIIDINDSSSLNCLDLNEVDKQEVQNSEKVFKPPASQTTSIIVSGSDKYGWFQFLNAEEEVSNSGDPMETIEPTDTHGNLDTEKDENQYYRPKKLRRMNDRRLSMDPSNETDPSVDIQDCKKSWSVMSETEKDELHEKNLSIDENQLCTKTVLTPEAITPVPSEELASEHSGGRSCYSKVAYETCEVRMASCEKMSEDPSQKDNQLESCASSSEDSESEEQKIRKSRPRALCRKDSKVWSQDDLTDGSSILTANGWKVKSLDKQDSILIKDDILSAKEDPQQDAPNKDEKEKKKRFRKNRKKDGLAGSVTKTSALQEAQLRREVLHEEERGRRLAQEIKGFNWLEQKIKNGSLLLSGSSATTSTSKDPCLASKSSPISLVLSNPKTPSSTTSFSFTAKKEEGECKISSLSGSSGSSGLRGHLQTAVPPLVPSSRVTALPKRRLSPTQLPAITHSTSAVLHSSTNVSSMTVQGTISSTVPTLHGTSHGKTGTNCGKPCVAAACDTTDSNRATLYSSTTCNKATVYGVNSDSLEVLYDSVTTSSANYYVRPDNNNASSYDANTPVPFSFCGSAKPLASIQNTVVQSSAGVASYPSITTTALAPTVPRDWPQKVKKRDRPPEYSQSDSSLLVSSDVDVVQHSCSGSARSQSADTGVPLTPQRFSHKHTLLRRAFREMLKSDSESSPEPAQTGKSPFKHGVSELEEPLAAFTPLLTTSVRLSSSTTEESPEASSKDSTKVVMSDCDTFQLDHKNSLSKIELEEPLDTIKQEEVLGADNKDMVQNIKTEAMQKISETIQSKVLETITDAGGEIDIESFRSETNSDKGKDDDKEIQSSVLLSVLYKELMRTKQEVQKLRKIQELMLTEKGDKEDDTEESKRGDVITCSEEKCEKRKCAKESDSNEPPLDCQESSHPEAKKSKISIRSDLLPADTSIMLAIPPSTSDNSCVPRNSSSCVGTSPSVLKNPQMSPTTKVPLVSPALSESSTELSVISLISSSVSQTGHASPRTSPGMSRSSPGVPVMSKTSPGLSRTSPGLPRTSPGLPRTSPGLPRTSPGLPRTSPGLPRTSPGLPRMSPGAPRTSSATPYSNVTEPHISTSLPQNMQTLSQTCPVARPIPTPLSSANTLMPRMTIAQTDSSPGAVRTRHATSYGSTAVPQRSPSSRTCPVIPKTSPVIQRVIHAVPRTSPAIPRTNSISSDIPLSKPDAQLTGMSPNKLRTAFGISNSEVEVMPVSVGGKFPLSEPQPQTFLKLVEDHHQQHHQPKEMSVLLDVGKGVQRNNSSKDIEILSSHGPSHFHCPQASHEDIRRTLRSHFYEGEIKGNAFSTSDLPDFPSPVRKQPPPLKPAASLVRRHSDSLDVRPVDPSLHRHAYSSTHTNPALSVHSTNSSSLEQQNTSLHSFSQPQCNPSQYPSNTQIVRRNSESSCPERSREYQQAVAISMKHPYTQHFSSGAPMMRSLGPDKATIFPIPAPVSTVIRPFKPPTPPASARTMLEQYQNENFYQSNFSFFERLRENIQQGCEPGSVADRGGHAAQERLQPPTGTVEKPIQPQTCAPRVLVRESIPETPRLPPPAFSAPNFATANQHLSTVLPSHSGGHFPNNMHPSNTVHHIVSAGLHPGSHQVSSSVMSNSNIGQHNSSSTSGSGIGEKRQCLNCPQSARFVCSGCKKAWYCSEKCQRDHWTVHNSACVP